MVDRAGLELFLLRAKRISSMRETVNHPVPVGPEWCGRRDLNPGCWLSSVAQLLLGTGNLRHWKAIGRLGYVLDQARLRPPIMEASFQQ